MRNAVGGLLDAVQHKKNIQKAQQALIEITLPEIVAALALKIQCVSPYPCLLLRLLVCCGKSMCYWCASRHSLQRSHDWGATSPRCSTGLVLVVQLVWIKCVVFMRVLCSPFYCRLAAARSSPAARGYRGAGGGHTAVGSNAHRTAGEGTGGSKRCGIPSGWCVHGVAVRLPCLNACLYKFVLAVGRLPQNLIVMPAIRNLLHTLPRPLAVRPVSRQQVPVPLVRCVPSVRGLFCLT